MADPFVDVQFVPGTVITSPWLNGINDSVSALLAFLGLSPVSHNVNSIADLRLLDKTKYSNVFTLGYYGPGTAGGGYFWQDTSDTTSVDNGGSIIVANDGARWKLINAFYGYASYCQFGAIGDGGTDDSVKVQNCIVAMKGKKAIADDGKTFFVNNLILQGSTFDNTILEGSGWHKLMPDGGNGNFQGTWTGIVFKDCSNITASMNWDGNRTAMTQREQIFTIGIAGANQLKFPTINLKELRGDGIYIGQSDWLANSGNSSNIYFDTVTAINSAEDGRNAISVISCVNGGVRNLRSINVGGVVNGFVMPGGLDFEPDHGYQFISNFTVGNADIQTAGNSGLGIFGKSISGNDANRDWNVQNITIQNVNILKTGTSGSAITATPFVRCADVTIVNGRITYNTTRGEGITHDFSQRIKANWSMSNVTVGTFLGRADALNDFDLNFNVSNYTVAGIRHCKLSHGRIRGSVTNAVGGSAFAIQAHDEGRGGIIQTDVSFEVDAPYDGVTLRAFRNEPGALVSFGLGTVVRDCNWSGYVSHATQCDAIIRSQNVLGRNNTNSVPVSGTWFFGDFVHNDAPAQSAGKILIGWSRLNSGNNNVLNNDWSNVFATIT